MVRIDKYVLESLANGMQASSRICLENIIENAQMRLYIGGQEDKWKH